jgi:hypothetical protein
MGEVVVVVLVVKVVYAASAAMVVAVVRVPGVLLVPGEAVVKVSLLYRGGACDICDDAAQKLYLLRKQPVI